MTDIAIAASIAALQQELSDVEETIANLAKQKLTVSQQPLERRIDKSSDHAQVMKTDNKMENPEKSGRAGRQLSETPIAIVGMSALFPQAENVSSYWDNILKEVNCITEVPKSRWDTEAYYDADPRAADKTYCKQGGFIPDIDFNPMEFGLPPNILEATDISQLLSLVVAREAIKDAGYSPHGDGEGGKGKALDRDAVGVVLGTVGRQMSGPLWARLQYPVWEKVLENSGISQADRETIIEKIKLAYVSWQENSFPGMLSNVTAGRIANRFNFGGLNCTLDAACASSLAALKMAISELTEHRADVMLTGGVDPDNSAFAYLCFSKTPALSRKQTSKPFDADSDGMMLGEGAGMVVLKRLADAERDGDRIYSVIRGLGTSSDGRYKSIYAPRPAGQLKALERAYQDANVDPTTVGLIEAHGTGTVAGDIAEFESLRLLFEQNKAVDEAVDEVAGETASKARPNSIALGSVKSQIGHTKTAAGIAGLIKASLALYHKVLPPTINISEPNVKLGIENSPFYLNTKVKPWISASDRPRRASVSSFGFGGTNFHVVMQEHKSEQMQAYRINPVPQPVLLFASSSLQLIEKCEGVLARVQQEGARAYDELLAASRTLKISTAAARLGFIADDKSDAISKLKVAISTLQASEQSSNRERWEHPKGVFYRRQGAELSGKVVALFSGQGAQYLEMGKAIAVNFPELRCAYRQMDAAMAGTEVLPVSQVVYPPCVFTTEAHNRQSEQLQATEYAQPAIGAFSMGLYNLFLQAGLAPSFACGHSFGELTALWASGVLSDADYCKLVRSRAKAMTTPTENTDAGTMLAVQGDISRLQALMPELANVEISNFNSSEQVVLAGAKSAISKAAKAIEKAGLSTMPLAVSGAFHTERMKHAQRPFSKAVDSVAFQPSDIPVYSNVTGEAYPEDAAEMQSVLQQHIVSPVKFRQQIENIYAAGGRCFVEFGPRRVLTNFVEEILGDRPHVAIPINASRRKDSDRQLREAAVRLRVEGLPLKAIDPYALPAAVDVSVSEKRKQLVVQLNGASYVSEKTKMAFQTALSGKLSVSSFNLQNANFQNANMKTTKKSVSQAKFPVQANGFSRSPTAFKFNGSANSATVAILERNGHSASENGSGRNERSREKKEASGHGLERSALNEKSSNAGLNLQKTKVNLAPVQAEPQLLQDQTLQSQILQSLDQTLSLFGQHQRQIANIHERYLENHQDYTKAAHQLTQQRQSLVSPADDKAVDSDACASSERVLMSFHRFQGETLRVHDKYLSGQMDCAKQFFELGQQTYQGLLENKPQKEMQRAPQDKKERLAPTKALLTVESDAVLSEVVLSKTEEAVHEPVPQIVQSKPVSPATVDIEEKATVSADFNLLQPALLGVVSDKTGYPVEMLEMEMDMEADLGIDSLKRVEIIGAFQELFPELAQPSIEELAERELRTLEQVVSYMKTLSTGEQTSDEQTISTNGSENYLIAEDLAPDLAPKEIAERSPLQAGESADDTPAPDSAITLETAQTQLLVVVSDKTGYPVEMLEMEMDMEADLGIDSLKRVEIVGAFQELFPELVQPSIEELAERELRTLAQVAEYMQSLSRAEPSQKKSGDTPFKAIEEDGLAQKKKSNGSGDSALDFRPDSELNAAYKTVKFVTRSPAHLLFLPPPDWLEVNAPKGRSCLITDDGSKTVQTVIQKLSEAAWKVVVLQFPTLPHSDSLPDGVEISAVGQTGDEYLGSLIDAIAHKNGPPALFIHFHPKLEANSNLDLFSPEVETNLLRQVFFMAKHLKPYLTQPPTGSNYSRCTFMTVARLNGAFGLPVDVDDTENAAGFSPVAGGLFGLVKTLRAEWPSVFCRAVDLRPNSESVDCVLAELHDPDKEIAEVAYATDAEGTRRRFTLAAGETL